MVRRRLAYSMILLVAFCLGGHTGCAVFSKPYPVKQGAGSHSGLIKPVIPPDENQPTNALKPPSERAAASSPAKDARDIPEQKDAKGLKKEWEDQKVTKAALGRAASLASIKKIQVCYIDADDEWTVFLYSDIGPAIEIKQFYWNRDAQTLEPHLVFKQIPKSRLQETLNEKRPGHSCENLDPPKR